MSDAELDFHFDRVRRRDGEGSTYLSVCSALTPISLSSFRGPGRLTRLQRYADHVLSA